MHCIAAKFVLRLLSEDQKHNHTDVSQELVDCINADKNVFPNLKQNLTQTFCSKKSLIFNC
jgi:hypothetical protein